MKKISFLGAAGMVTGSNYLLSGDNSKDLLIDLGLFQGLDEKDGATDRNHAPLAFDGHNLEAVILTHAHLDHCGRLPLLAHSGFSGKIYMTRATRALTELSLYDSAHIGRDPGNTALFTEQEVKMVLEQAVTLEYDEDFRIGPYAITMRDAGHILGSATVEIVDTQAGDKIVFSGDLGNYPQDLIKPTRFINDADVVVMESTYGDRSHPREDAAQILQAEINHIEQTGGTLLIPSFSLERTQEVLHLIDHLKKLEKVHDHTRVYLDSPMSIAATDIFRLFKELYNEELRQHVKTDDPFSFPGFVAVDKARHSSEIWQDHRAKVIIAGSGMMTGGRIVAHAAHYLPHPTTRLLFVGYQGEDTLGRLIQEGAPTVTIAGETVPVHATIKEIQALSSHADQPRLLQWLQHINGVKQVILTHGENSARSALADKIKSDLQVTAVFLPQMFDRLEV